MWTMSKLAGAAAAALAVAGTTVARAGETNTGVAMIGGSHLASADRSVLQKAVNEAFAGGTHKLEIAVLANEFDPEDPYGDIDSMARNILSKMGSDDHLRITVYLWFHHRDYGDYGVYKKNNSSEYKFRYFDWGAFSSVDPPKGHKEFRKYFDKRLGAFNAFAKGLRGYAGSVNRLDQLGVTLVPELEDTGTDKHAWDVLKTVIANAQSGAGIPATPLRRCLGTGSAFRVSGLPLEMHAAADDKRTPGKQLQDLLDGGKLKPGDVFTLDGRATKNLDPGSGEFKELLAAQKRAIGAGVSVLWWRGSFNGGPGGSYPALRPGVSAFGGSGSSDEAKAMKKAIVTR